MSLNSQQMEQAEARCLELVNDGAAHKEYSKAFDKALGRVGLRKLKNAAVTCKQGSWLRLSDFPEASDWAGIRARHKFDHYNGKNESNVFGRTVFGLVLEHWLSSNAGAEPKDSAPCKFKEGDTVRIKVSQSLGGNTRYKIGEHAEVSGWTTYRSKDVVIVGGNYYRPEDLELVTGKPVKPHGLDRAIAEQKEYYAPKNPCSEITVEDYAMGAALEEARKLTNSANARIERINSILNKETAMSLKIETKTFVNSVEISKMTVEDLVSLISSTEAEIEKLEKLNSKPKKVVAKIEELKAGLIKLVEFADAE